MPSEWSWYKFDKLNIISIVGPRNFFKLKTYPSISGLKKKYLEVFHGINWVPFLDYLAFDKASALSTLTTQHQYTPYPYKHYESIFTRFYQAYILPNKFNVDKRLVHLSTLVLTGQITRDYALSLLKTSTYPDSRQFYYDKSFFLKKMKWTESQLNNYLSSPPTKHSSYQTEISLMRLYSVATRLFKQLVALCSVLSTAR